MTTRMNIDGFIGELSTLPGCSQVVVSHSVFALAEVAGKGKASAANEKRQKIAAELGYDYILCTVASNNEKQIRVLENTHWQRLSCFHSRKTGHLVYLYGRLL